VAGLKKELAHLELPLLIEYGVLPEEKEQALAVYEKYRHSPAAVSLLRCYYSDLPEAREEMAVGLKIVASRQGTDLVVLQSTRYDYLYLHADNQVLLLGEFKDGIEDESILHYFQFKSREDFWEKTGTSTAHLPSMHAPESNGLARACVACGVKTGEYHILGCPVEQCPWCEAQLSHCNCRFDQLGVSVIEEDEQLDRFELVLERKGRIAFDAGQNPSYPTAGDDPGPGELKNK
jgi:hypothetical protein